jgi:multimeric flavodoxin WrbA
MHEHSDLTQVCNTLEERPPRASILGVGGSPRKKGNSDVLLEQILTGAREKEVAATGIHLRDIQYSGCIGCEKCRKDLICTGLDDGMTVLYPDIYHAKGLVLVSPTHNYNITAWMKAFIDRLYCFYTFADTRPRAWSSRMADQGRKAVLAAICEQEHPRDMGFTLEAMRLPLETLGYDIVGELPVFSVFEPGKVRDKEDVLASAKWLGEELALALDQ